ncbi:hypothetical protein AAMO2058_000502700 [Amorphochlora amoebiformis]
MREYGSASRYRLIDTSWVISLGKDVVRREGRERSNLLAHAQGTNINRKLRSSSNSSNTHPSMSSLSVGIGSKRISHTMMRLYAGSVNTHRMSFSVARYDE